MADDDARSRSHWWRFLRRHPYGTALAFVLAFLSFWVPDLLCLLRGWHPLRILLMAGVLAAGLRLVYLWYRHQNISSSPEPNEDRPQFFQLFDWCVITFVGAGMLLGGSWWIWGFSLKEQSAARATSALSTVAGLGGAVFLVVKYRTQALAERQEAREEEAAQRDKEAAERDKEAAERDKERLVDEREKAHRELERAKQQNLESRFSEAIRMLGDTAPSTRIAGVYALTDIADSKKGPFKQRVVDILCGYLRTDRLEKDAEGNTRYHPNDDGAPDTSRPISRDGAVESTIIQVIASHLRAEDPDDLEKGSQDGSLSGDQLWCECSLNLRGAIFTETLDFSQCVVSADGTDFSEAKFFGGVKFSEATFKSRANFAGTHFKGECRFDRVNFCARAIFERAEFNRAAEFTCARFNEAMFEGAVFRGNALFGRAKFAEDAGFQYAKFSSLASFGSSTFKGRTCFLEAEFQKANFSLVTFKGEADFQDISFLELNFANSKFESSANFAGARSDTTPILRVADKVDFGFATFTRRPEAIAGGIRPWTGRPPGAEWADDPSEDHPEGESA